MTGMNEEFDAFVRKSFEEMTRGVGERAIVTNFVVVAEVVDGESSDIAISFSDGMTPWLADGLLRAAADMITRGKWQIRDNGDEGEV